MVRVSLYADVRCSDVFAIDILNATTNRTKDKLNSCLIDLNIPADVRDLEWTFLDCSSEHLYARLDFSIQGVYLFTINCFQSLTKKYAESDYSWPYSKVERVVKPSKFTEVGPCENLETFLVYKNAFVEQFNLTKISEEKYKIVCSLVEAYYNNLHLVGERGKMSLICKMMEYAKDHRFTYEQQNDFLSIIHRFLRKKEKLA